MARLTDDQRELILADFHTGQYSQHKLAQRHKVSSKTINTIVKGLEPKHNDKVNTLVSVKTELYQESKQEVNAVEDIVNKRVEHLLFFQDSALKNQRLANKVVDENKDNINTIESHSRITQRNKETVLGKDKTIELNNTNANQNNNEVKTINVKYS